MSYMRQRDAEHTLQDPKAVLSSGKQLPVFPALFHTCVPTLPLPSVYKRQHGFSGHLGRLTVLFSLPGDSPAASKALPATKSAPEKLRRTCQREKTGAGKKEDAGGLTPAKDDDAASVDFCRWQAYCPLYTEGMVP